MSSNTSRGVISLIALFTFLLYSFANTSHVDMNLLFIVLDVPHYVVAFALFALGIMGGFTLGLLAGDAQRE
jgi:uncharacterized integral membrane protein